MRTNDDKEDENERVMLKTSPISPLTSYEVMRGNLYCTLPPK